MGTRMQEANGKSLIGQKHFSCSIILALLLVYLAQLERQKGRAIRFCDEMYIVLHLCNQHGNWSIKPAGWLQAPPSGIHRNDKSAVMSSAMLIQTGPCEKQLALIKYYMNQWATQQAALVQERRDNGWQGGAPGHRRTPKAFQGHQSVLLRLEQVVNSADSSVELALCSQPASQLRH